MSGKFIEPPATLAKKALLLAQSNGLVVLQYRNGTKSRHYWLPRAWKPFTESGMNLSRHSLLGQKYLESRLQLHGGQWL